MSQKGGSSSSSKTPKSNKGKKPWCRVQGYYASDSICPKKGNTTTCATLAPSPSTCTSNTSTPKVTSNLSLGFAVDSGLVREPTVATLIARV